MFELDPSWQLIPIKLYLIVINHKLLAHSITHRTNPPGSKRVNILAMNNRCNQELFYATGRAAFISKTEVDSRRMILLNSSCQLPIDEWVSNFNGHCTSPSDEPHKPLDNIVSVLFSGGIIHCVLKTLWRARRRLLFRNQLVVERLPSMIIIVWSLDWVGCYVVVTARSALNYKIAHHPSTA